MFSFTAFNRHNTPQNNEVMQVALPFAQGVVTNPEQIGLEIDGVLIPSQARITGRWKDGSIRWSLVHWISNLPGKSSADMTVNIDAKTTSGAALLKNDSDGTCTIDTGLLKLKIGMDPSQWIQEISIPHSEFDEWTTWSPKVKGGQLFATLEDAELTPQFDGPPEILDNGPLVSEIFYRGKMLDSKGIDRLRFRLRLRASKNSANVRVSLTLHNPRDQPREEMGHFRLGLDNAAMISDAGIRLNVPGEGIYTAFLAGECGKADFMSPITENATLYQDSSGTENWCHRTHINRDWQLPQQFRGYKMSMNGQPSYEGNHAGGWGAVGNQHIGIAIGVEKFWQNFPKALRIDTMNQDQGSITCSLFPNESRYAHELVGGEQKTHHIHFLFFRADGQVINQSESKKATPLAIYPLLKEHMHRLLNTEITLPHAEQVIAADVIQETQPYNKQKFPEYENAVACAFEDPNFTLFDLRDKWDDYGWRNFGDFNADSEINGQILSHHNNEYDFSRGLLMQALRYSGHNDHGAQNFLEAGFYAATHQADIDIYHTTEDKHDDGIYNGGKFTHTAHAIEPGRGGHRQSDSHLFYGDLDWPWGLGGGPESGHFDNEGMMLAYYLCGDPILLEASIELADLVHFKVINDKFPSHDYDRTTGNNISCCVTAWVQTWDDKYLNAINISVDKTTPDHYVKDQTPDIDGLIPIGGILAGVYLKGLLYFIHEFKRATNEDASTALANVFFYSDCLHRYGFSEEHNAFAYSLNTDLSNIIYTPLMGGGAGWFNIDALTWVAMLRKDPDQRRLELNHCRRAYETFTKAQCPEGKPKYHHTKTFTYTTNNGHSILIAKSRYPDEM
ncbi:MAG: hypothetical protein COA79_14420 [Planctomycetota bacterium]|nr:MAG: hypothetical protein COA79_14420 [Planctomycetota bacterium]